MVSSQKHSQIILLDFFKDYKNEINEIMSSPLIYTLCEPIIDLTVVFSDIKKTEKVLDFVDTIDLPSKEINGLKEFFKHPFQTSFSYGFKNKEFVFIRVEKSSPILETKNKEAFSGLIIHEILHSVQRQRGMEIRLNNSLVFSLDFFTELASLIPPGVFKKDNMIIFLKEISQISLFALKDIYVNIEMMKRGMESPLLKFYKIELGFYESNKISPPHFDTPFEKGEIRIQDLNEFGRAFNFTISLIPVWLPSIILGEESVDYDSSRELKHFIFDKYYVNPSLITREMWQLENIFLTSFSFSKSFHVKWFGAIFNLALEYLLGEDFVFYHLSKAAELIEEIYQGNENLERRSFAMVPILKAAYVHKKEYPAGIQQRNIDELEALMKRYEISKEDILELEESITDKLQTEGGYVAHLFEDLLKLSIMIIAKDFRKHILAGYLSPIKGFGRTILTILQTINYLGDLCDSQYYHSVRLNVKKIVRSNNVFQQKKLSMDLETISKAAIFKSDLEPTLKEISELLFNFDFFEIPLSNIFVELGVNFIQNIKMVLRKVAFSDPDFPLLASQFIGILIREMRLKTEELDQINVILVCSLIASSGVPFSLIQSVLEEFVSVLHTVDEDNTNKDV